MAKESFVLYKSMYDPIKDLSPEHKGEFLDAIFLYQIEGVEPDKSSPIYMAFLFFKNQFKLDDKKYEKVVERNKNNGNKGGRPTADKKEEKENPKNPVGLNKPKKADNDNVNGNDTENVNDKKNTLEERKLKFASTLQPFLDKYGNEMLNDFYKYWTESNNTKTKFRREYEKTWDIDRRLETWAKKQKEFSKEKGSAQKENRLQGTFNAGMAAQEFFKNQQPPTQ